MICRLKPGWFALLLLVAAWGTLSGFAQEIALPPIGSDTATGWTLSGGAGKIIDDVETPDGVALVVEGTGDDTNYWRTPALPLDPSSVYVFDYGIRRFGRKGQGTPIGGPVFANVDHTWVRQQWETFEDVFMTPVMLRDSEAWLRVGQWHEEAPVAFSGMALVKAIPMHQHIGSIVLGRCESIDGNQYTFRTDWPTSLTDYARPLIAHDCRFNTARMVFGKDSFATFQFQIGDRRQASAEFQTGLFYRFAGRLIVEASIDGERWQVLGALETAGTLTTYRLPAQLFPASTVWVRLRAEADAPLGEGSDMGALSVAHLRYRANLDGAPLRATGQTLYMKSMATDPALTVTGIDLGALRPGVDAQATIKVTNNAAEASTTTAALHFTARSGKEAIWTVTADLAPGLNTVQIPYALHETGDLAINLTIGDYHGAAKTYVADLYADSYGAVLPGSDASATVWRAGSGWKVAKTRPVPTAKADSLAVSAARNETEAVQLIITPQRPLHNLRFACSDLAGPEGTVLPASVVEVLSVGYVYVQQPTDYMSTTDYWPDPLPPIDGPLNLPAGENAPFWVRVSVPSDARPGAYQGLIQLTADGYTASVPLAVRVYGFTLPNRMTCETAFGLGTDKVFQYHGAKTDQAKAAVLDKYLEDFSKHHISPYDPAPLTPFVVTWPDIAPGQQVDPATLAPTIDWTAWDAAMRRSMDGLYFNSFRFPVPGMGGGSYTDRAEPELLGFADDAPEYQALFGSYCRQVEAHLKEKGWLDFAYVYWVDEPDIRDYPFVMNGFHRLEQYAPGLRRMLTEQVEPELAGGPNLWCPNSPHFDMAQAEERRKHGEHFWWYLCTGPKAPYATLFIDHAGTELRAFLWQTWQRKIDGVLIWDTTQWTSRSMYPGKNNWQNPYEDPMSWTGDAAPGTANPWGNGDGRFMYPPKAGANGKPRHPLIEGPVDSIRWEMLRDGIDDYEYFVILKRLLSEKGDRLSPEEREAMQALLKVPASVTTDMTTFTKDPAPMMAHREKLAAAIERLTAL